jgi:hypothetical protein
MRNVSENLVQKYQIILIQKYKYFILSFSDLSGLINDSFSLLIVTFAVLMVVSIRRVKQANRGSKINVRNTVFFSAYYVAVVSILVYNSFIVASISLLYILPYFIVVVAAMFGSYLVNDFF